MAPDSLRIALLAPLVSPIRQPYLGGAQALVRDLAVSLAERGHSVTIYAAAGTDPTALPRVRLIEIPVLADRLRPGDFSGEREGPEPASDSAMESAFLSAYGAIAERSREYDLIHAHAYDRPAFTIGAAQPLPIAHTLHMPDLHSDISQTLKALAPARQPRRTSQPWLITVSHWCASTYDQTCRIDAVIPNGVDLAAIPFGARAANPPYLVFAGRIAPEKGAADAITIARAARMRLIMAGGAYDQAYFAAQIQPALDAEPEMVQYIGAVAHERVWSLMAGATAVLVPSHWEEPFGLAACEAQAAGAPVVGYGRGGLRDIVINGETGFLVEPGATSAAAAAIPLAARLDRAACRDQVAARFTLARMVAAHERLYQRMLSLS